MANDIRDAADIAAAQEPVEARPGLAPPETLRFITCGGVDDGKSTLIGRLLFDSKLLFDDQISALRQDSRKFGTTGAGEMDLALLVDGLQAEREQGITIDVAYRYFASERRKFIVADTPGHEQYTRNMVTGASNSELAVLLVDASKGLLTQTRRHSFLVSLLGIRHVAIAINKMDLAGWDQARFDSIATGYRDFAAKLGISDITAIPLSALTGDNVLHRSDAMPWYRGPTLLDYLDSVDVFDNIAVAPFRMPVQWVNRPDSGFRGYSGTVVSGLAHPGDSVAILPSGRTTVIDRIVTLDGDLPEAVPGHAVTVTLADDIDVGRGDLIAAADNRPQVADQFAAHLAWMADQPLLPGRGYIMRLGPLSVGVQVTELKHKVNVNTLEHTASKHLDLNEIGFCNFALDRAVPFEPYSTNRTTGGFVMVDRATNATVACGMISFPLRRALNVHWQHTDVDKTQRSSLKSQSPCVLWLTGLSGSGKSTVANIVEKKLLAMGRHTYLLDGDNVRHGLNKDLGFTDEDRVENIRRVAECARLFVDAGLIVLTAFISPFRAERQMARDLVPDGEFFEIFIDTPLGICEQRDPKGLYKKARAGELPNFTGIDSPYEQPASAELTLDGSTLSAEEMADQIIAMLASRRMM